MAFALPFIAAAGTVVSAAGAIYSGEAQAQAAQYQAKVASNNALIARQNATHAAQATAVQTEDAGTKAGQQDAAVKAGLAANNLDVNSGSAADVEGSQRRIGLLDTATVANRGAEEQYGYSSQSQSFQSQSELDKAQAGYDVTSGFLKAGGSLLSGASNLSPTFAWMQGGSGAGGLPNPNTSSAADSLDI
jgi:hypothetical protein